MKGQAVVFLALLCAITVWAGSEDAVAFRSFVRDEAGSTVAQVLFTIRTMPPEDYGKEHTKVNALLHFVVVNGMKDRRLQLLRVVSDGDAIEEYVERGTVAPGGKVNSPLVNGLQMYFSPGKDETTTINIEYDIVDAKSGSKSKGSSFLSLDNLPEDPLLVTMTVRDLPVREPPVAVLETPKEEAGTTVNPNLRRVAPAKPTKTVAGFDFYERNGERAVSLHVSGADRPVWNLGWASEADAGVLTVGQEPIRSALQDGGHAQMFGTILASMFRKDFTRTRDYVGVGRVGRVFPMAATDKSKAVVVAVCDRFGYVLEFTTVDGLGKYYRFDLTEGVGSVVVLREDAGLSVCLCCDDEPSASKESGGVTGAVNSPVEPVHLPVHLPADVSMDGASVHGMTEEEKAIEQSSGGKDKDVVNVHL